jgi:tRNA(Phe) wybutosine-synthesizing methylase Tyw3
MAFDPKEYDDNTLVEAIKSLRRSRSDYHCSWCKKRIAVLEHEANRRKLNIQPTPKNDRHPM